MTRTSRISPRRRPWSQPVPLPRSRPAEANLQARADGPFIPPVPLVQSDNRTLFQKLVDMVPGRIRLASLEPNGGLGGSAPNLGALGFDNVTAVYDISARPSSCPMVRSSRRIQAWEA